MNGSSWTANDFAHARFAGAIVLCFGVLGASLPSAAAQDADVAAASQAFNQARAAQLAGRHAEAADLFELAHRIAPSPQAIRSAIRNHMAAEASARAATLALAALREFGADADTRAAAEEALELAPELGRLRVECDAPCLVVVDQRTVNARSARRIDFFVDAGSHEVAASWEDGGRATESTSVDAGAQTSLRFEEPEPEPEPEPDSSEAATPRVAAPDAGTLSDGGDGGISPVFALVGAGLTLAGAGVTIWSGLDTLDRRDVYEATLTQETLDQGLAAETRTNAVLGVTIGLGVATAVLAILTDWDGDDDGARADLRFGPGFAGLDVSVPLGFAATME